MKISLLRDKLVKARDYAADEEIRLIEYRKRKGGGKTTSECEATAAVRVFNTVIKFLEDLVYDENIDFRIRETLGGVVDEST